MLGAVLCCQTRGNGRTTCNECGAVLKAVPAREVKRTLDEMELSLDLATAKCPQCGSVSFKTFVTDVFSGNGYYGLLMKGDTFVGTGYDKRVRRMGGKARARFVIGQFWNCKDIMPWGTCSDLDLPQGSNYAVGARKLRDVLHGELYSPLAG